METEPPVIRALAPVTGALLLVTAALHVLGATVLRESFWGVHHYGFFPPFWLPAATLLLLACGWLLSPAAADRLEPAWRRLPATGGGRRQAGLLGLLAVAGGAVFWLGRSGHVILGDGSVAVVNVSRLEALAPREPLTGILQKQAYALGERLFGGGGATPEEIAHRGLALGSVLAGVLFLPIAWGLARELAKLRPGATAGKAGPETILLFLCLVTQGYIQLFFGYVENYTYVTAAMAAYLWLSLRAIRTGGSLLPAGAALGLAVLLHLSAAVYLPSFLVLAAGALLRRRGRRRRLGELAVSAALVGGGAVALARLGNGYDLPGHLLEVTRLALLERSDSAPGYLLSAVHLRDFLNEQLLIGPLGLFLFLPALGAAAAGWARRSRGPGLAPSFLVAAALAYAGVSWLAGESNLGYPRNWDLLAPGSLAFTAAGLGLFLAAGAGALGTGGERRRHAAAPILLCAVAISLYHTAPWVALNTSFELGFERLKTLPSSGGITETNVGRWYLLRGDPQQGRAWLERALEVNPGNNNAHYLLGLTAMDEGRYTDAVESFHQAASALPEKVEYRRALVKALLAAEAYPNALDQCRDLLARVPGDPEAVADCALALAGSGRPRDALRVFAHLRETVELDLSAREMVSRALCGAAAGYESSGHWLEAAAFLQEATAWTDDGPEAERQQERIAQLLAQARGGDATD